MIYYLFFLTFLVLAEHHAISLYFHSWCPPCKKVNTIFQRLQKSYPHLHFATHKYTHKTSILSNKTGQILSFPTIIFQCFSHRFTYQNDLNYAQLSYWIDVVCLHKIPSCSEKINDQLYHIFMEDTPQPSIQLINQILKHPHIKVCTSQHSNRTSHQVLTLLRETDAKTLYFDYFSNNIRNYLIQSNKLAIALITPQKNTSRVNSFMQSYASLENFMSQQKINKTQIYRYELPQDQKKQLVFLQLCYNSNISKCIYQSNRKSQVQSNRRMIQKLLYFFDMETGNNMDQVIAFKFDFPHFQKHIYHNFGGLDEKFIFWINQILTTTPKSVQMQQQCYWNSITHRISDNNLEDIETHVRLSKFVDKISEDQNSRKFRLNRIVKNYHSQPKFTVCLQGKKPINYKYNQQIGAVQRLVKDYWGKLDDQL